MTGASGHILLRLLPGPPREGRSSWNQRKPGEIFHTSFHPMKGSPLRLWGLNVLGIPLSHHSRGSDSVLRCGHFYLSQSPTSPQRHAVIPLWIPLFLLPGSIWTSGSSRIPRTSRCQGKRPPGWEIKDHGCGNQLVALGTQYPQSNLWP